MALWRHCKPSGRIGRQRKKDLTSGDDVRSSRVVITVLKPILLYTLSQNRARNKGAAAPFPCPVQRINLSNNQESGDVPEADMEPPEREKGCR